MTSFPGSALFLAAVVFAPACSRSADGARPRHLLLVTVDTLRADHLGAWGYERGTSDRASAAKRGSVAGFTIDELASQGLRFDNAFAPRGETCPSLATLFTGQPPLEHCLIENESRLPESAETLAEAFASKGFATAAFTTNNLLVKGSGFEQGFAHFENDVTPDRDARTVNAAREWLAHQDLAHGPPVFVWVHLMGPHLPYDPLPIDGLDYQRLFSDPAYKGLITGDRKVLDAVYAEQRPLSDADVAHAIALYDGEVARIDRLVSRFAQECSKIASRSDKSLLDDALFVFAADHGEELHERYGYWAHSKSVYGSVLHVPLFVRHPATLKAGRVIEDGVSLEDVLPTLADRFAWTASSKIHGRSLARYLDGADSVPELAMRPAVSMWRDKIFSLRAQAWRLVSNPDLVEPDDTPPGPYPVPKLALFDLARDPRETTDVSTAHPEVVRELARELTDWLAQLEMCPKAKGQVSADRLKALRELGYAGEDEPRAPASDSGKKK